MGLGYYTFRAGGTLQPAISTCAERALVQVYTPTREMLLRTPAPSVQVPRPLLPPRARAPEAR